LPENNRNKEKKELNDSLRVADDKVNKARNNRYNWNVIDIVYCNIYCIPKRKEPKRLKVAINK